MAAVLFLTVMAFSSNAQEATITNDLDCDVKIRLMGITSTCGTTSQVVTVSPGTTVVAATASTIEWLVGGQLMEVGTCDVSEGVKDCSNITCSCTLQAQTSFTLAVDCCNNAEPTPVALEVHQNGNDCQIRIYD